MLNPSRIAVFAAVLLLPGLALAASNAPPKDEDRIELRFGKAGAELRTDTSPAEVGIAVYPGAVREHGADGDSPAVSLGLWGEKEGFHLALIKYRSRDAPAKVQAYYEKELARFGQVTVCRPGQDAGTDCDVLDANSGVELRAGPEKDRRVVALTPHAGYTELVIMRVQQPGSK